MGCFSPRLSKASAKSAEKVSIPQERQLPDRENGMLFSAPFEGASQVSGKSIPFSPLFM